MSGIDWSKSQPSDTHYDTENRLFVNFDAMHDWNRKLVARPSPAWSGEGLPPVGTACQINGTVLQELKGHERSWRKVEIIAHTHFGGVDVAVGRDLECATLGWGTPAVFRPIRTPEQIAADERHEAVMRMSDIVGGIEKVPSWTDAIEALYDAGLRFSEQDK